MDHDEGLHEGNALASSSSSTALTSHQRVIICFDLDCFFVQVEQHRNPSLLKSHSLIAVQQHDDLIAISYAARKRGVQKHDTPQIALQKCPELKLVHVPMFPSTSKVTYQHYRSHSQSIFQFIVQYLKTDALFKRFHAGPMEKASIDEAFIDVTKLSHGLASCVDQVDRIDELCDRLNCETVPLPGEKKIDYCELKRAIIARNRRNANKDDTKSDESSNSGSENDDDGIDMLLSCLESSSESPETSTSRAVHDNDYFDIDTISEHDVLLFMGNIVALKLREAVKEKLGYEATCGIAPNKLLAKLASSLQKPNNQTVVFMHQINAILEITPIAKIPKLASHLGSQDNMFRFLDKVGEGTKSMADLQRLKLNELDDMVGEKASNFLFNCARGIDRELVVQKGPPKQVSVSMSLTPISNEHMHAVNKIIGFLALEIVERLKEDRIEYQRHPCSIHCKYRLVDCKEISTNSSILNSKICGDKNKIQEMIYDSFEKSVKKNYVHVSKWGLRWISIVTTSFTPVIREKETVLNFFQRGNENTTGSSSHITQHASTSSNMVVENEQNDESAAHERKSNMDQNHDTSLFAQDKNTTLCPVCNRSIPISLATIHVNNHFNNEASSSRASASTSSPVKRSVTSTKKSKGATTKNKRNAPPSNTLDKYFKKSKKD